MLKKCLYKIKDSVKQDNSGMALVTVIVCIGFVAALVSIILTTSLVNFKMKSVESKSKDSFYSAEQALDEINIYLQKVVSDSMSEAYYDIMSNYATYDDKKKTELLETKYFENIWKTLGTNDGKNYQEYDVTKLEEWLKDTTVWHGDQETGYGAIVVAESKDGIESKVGKMVTYQNNGVVLEGLKVYYKDEKGFVSVVKTDVRMGYPRFDFAPSSEFPDIIDYCVIADKELTVGEESAVPVQRKVTFSGNLYANQLRVVDGPSASQRSKVTFSGDKDEPSAGTLTVRYDFDVNKNVDVEFLTDYILRSRNIIVDSSKFAVSSKGSSVQVTNDLNLKGVEPKVSVSGQYIGFGNADMKDTTESGVANRSSAILVNGEKSELDFSKASDFMLLGHSFIGTSDETMIEGVETVPQPDILMGESVGVKSDQLIYLVPEEAIGVDIKTHRCSELFGGKNPLTKTEYENLSAQIEAQADKLKQGEEPLTHYVIFDDDLEIASLDGTKLSEYNAGYQEIHVSGSEDVVYFYLKFDDPKDAERYFDDYYKKNKKSLFQYLKFYLKNAKIPRLSSIPSAVSGPLYTEDKTDEDGLKIDSQQNEYLSGEESDKYYAEYVNMCRFLSTKDLEKLNEGKIANPYAGFYSYDKYDDAGTTGKPNSVIFENIVDLSMSTKAGSSDSIFDQFIKDAPNITTPIAGLVLDWKDEDDYQAAFDNYGITQQEVKAGGCVRTYTNPDVAEAYEIEKNGLTITISDPVAVICKSETYDIFVNDMSYANVKLVISKGNVKVNKDFSGLLLSNNLVDLVLYNGDSNKEYTISSSPDEVKQILKLGYFDEEEGLINPIASVLRDGTNFVYSANDPKGDLSDLSLGNLITYENWSKQ